MDKLKNFIDANRDAFEEDEILPEGHFAETTEEPCGSIQPIGLCHSRLYRLVAPIPLAGWNLHTGARAKNYGPSL